jgi:hypothetical protein
MSSVPPEMMTNDREPDPHFADDEILFRRFRPDDIEAGEIPLEAFELPVLEESTKIVWMRP